MKKIHITTLQQLKSRRLSWQTNETSQQDFEVELRSLEHAAAKKEYLVKIFKEDF